jgi:uncharacterized protein YecE (DUF72 family)
MGGLREELAVLLNQYSAEVGCDTPDFVLAQFLMECLAAFDSAVCAREQWYGRPAGSGAAIPVCTNAGD